MTDLVKGFSDSSGGCGRLLPRVESDDVSSERGRRGEVDEVARSDDAAYCARNQESLRDPVRPWEHQPLHAGATLVIVCEVVLLIQLNALLKPMIHRLEVSVHFHNIHYTDTLAYFSASRKSGLQNSTVGFMSSVGLGLVMGDTLTQSMIGHTVVCQSICNKQISHNE